MTSTKNQGKRPQKKSRGRNAWRTLSRDAHGRWTKAKPQRSGQSQNTTKSHHTDCIDESAVTNTLDSIKKNFDMNCPRCSGDMKFFRIRCGPERLVQVKKCTVCNFWLPTGN